MLQCYDLPALLRNWYGSFQEALLHAILCQRKNESDQSLRLLCTARQMAEENSIYKLTYQRQVTSHLSVNIYSFVRYIAFHSTLCAYRAAYIQHVFTANWLVLVAIFKTRCQVGVRNCPWGLLEKPESGSAAAQFCPQLLMHSLTWLVHATWTCIWRHRET